MEDEKVIDYLKIYTFLTKEEIEEIERIHKEKPELRLAQKELAKGIITFLHGEEDYNRALFISECLFSGNIKELTKEELDILYTDDYIERTNKYIYYPSFLDNNPIFELDYVEEEKFKIIKKTN